MNFRGKSTEKEMNSPEIKSCPFEAAFLQNDFSVNFYFTKY
jgi:hypothetical protein